MLNPNIFLGFQPPSSAEGLKRWPSLPAEVAGAQRFLLPKVWLENHVENTWKNHRKTHRKTRETHRKVIGKTIGKP